LPGLFREQSPLAALRFRLARCRLVDPATSFVAINADCREVSDPLELWRCHDVSRVMHERGISHLRRRDGNENMGNALENFG
jgi:hypothetical protein